MRLKSDRVDRNSTVCGSDGMLQWMLKSPVMMKCGTVAAKFRKEVNSSMNTENVVW